MVNVRVVGHGDGVWGGCQGQELNEKGIDDAMRSVGNTWTV